MQRLLFIHSSDELYGADRILLEQLDSLPAGVQAQVWLPADLAHPDRALCTEIARRQVPYRHLALPIMRRAYRTPIGLTRLSWRALGLRAAIRAARPDLVYCTTSAALLAAPVARSCGVPLVLGHVHEVWRRADRLALTGPARACHRLLAISNAVLDSLPALLHERTTIVPNGTTDPGDVESLDGRDGDLRFVVASRWNAWKGHATLLRAWDQLSHGTLYVLGGPPPSGQSTDVVALVGSLRRPESVRILGEVDDSARWIRAADVALVPSDEPEPFGLVAIEAFAQGRPVIASAGGGLLDIVTDGRDGWLFRPGDADALAALLAGLDRDAVRAAAAAARRTYLDRYTAQRYAQAWRSAVGL